MKKFIFIAFLFFCAMVVGALLSPIAFFYGAKWGHTQCVKNEMEEINVCLGLNSAYLGNELREYLTERYYFLAYFLSDADLADYANDYGLPTTNYCKVSGGREPFFEQEYYTFTQRMEKVLLEKRQDKETVVGPR